MFWQRFKEQLKEYVTFTRKERNGVLVLFLLLALSQAAVVYTHYMEIPGHADFSRFEKQLTEFRNSLAPPDSVSQLPPVKIAHYEEFDPNRADSAQLASLGLPVRTIRSILKFRRKGGRFNKKDDLQKIYNLNATDYERLKPYIRITPERSQIIFNDKENRLEKPPVEIVELNSAAKEELMTLPMIGEKRAEQIIKFRNRLGGFFKKEQLKEVYSLPDSIYSAIAHRVEVNPSLVRQIDLNAMTDSTYHPYIKKNLVKLIVAYRNQHGHYLDKEAIKKMPLMNDSLYEKLEPYITAGIE